MDLGELQLKPQLGTGESCGPILVAAVGVKG
jgi:hypothetical protein